MRLLIAILLFISLQSQAQIVRAHPLYRPPVSGCSYLLEQYSGAAAAYSLRLLDCYYAGSAIRVRRSSDNTEQDIGFVNGNLDTASLKTFVGTGGTDNGFVVTWYDQSGNSRNATQSTASFQPQIVFSGVINRNLGKPAIFGDGSDDVLKVSLSLSSNLIYTFSVATRESGGRTDGRFLSFGNDGSHDWNTTSAWAAITVNSTTSAYTYRNSAQIANASTTLGTSYLYYAYLNGSSGGIAINNNSPSTGSTSATSISTSQFAIFAAVWASTLGEFKGDIQEVIVYTSDASSNRSGINSNINTYYSVY